MLEVTKFCPPRLDTKRTLWKSQNFDSGFGARRCRSCVLEVTDSAGQGCRFFLRWVSNSAWVVGEKGRVGERLFPPCCKWCRRVAALRAVTSAVPGEKVGRATFSPAHCARRVLSGGLLCGDFVGDGRMHVKCSNAGFGLEEVP